MNSRWNSCTRPSQALTSSASTVWRLSATSWLPPGPGGSMSSARHAFARRSARALGCAVAAFLAGQLALGLAVERWLPAARDPEYAAKVERLRARRAEAPGRPLVLVLGSSR